MPSIGLANLNYSSFNSTNQIVNNINLFVKLDHTAYVKLSLIILIISLILLLLCLILKYDDKRYSTSKIPFERMQKSQPSSISLEDNPCNCNNVTSLIKSFSKDQYKNLM